MTESKKLEERGGKTMHEIPPNATLKDFSYLPTIRTQEEGLGTGSTS